MGNRFSRVLIYGRPRPTDKEFSETLIHLTNFLSTHQLSIFLETETAHFLEKTNLPVLSLDQLSGQCDVIMVVGGDGSLLNAARFAAQANVPVLGINRGRLGFLTDIKPVELEEKILEILQGYFQIETRFLIEAEISHEDKIISAGDALNEVVLLPGDIVHMIEFTIFIDDEMVCHQRADGMIVATPTGSTAYSLSGGGPILHPRLNAMVLVPMFPHTLSSRPIVIDGNSQIRIVVSENNPIIPRVSCDGQATLKIQPGDSILLRKKKELLTLIHPQHYNYYETLRSKLHWETNH